MRGAMHWVPARSVPLDKVETWKIKLTRFRDFDIIDPVKNINDVFLFPVSTYVPNYDHLVHNFSQKIKLKDKPQNKTKLMKIK